MHLSLRTIVDESILVTFQSYLMYRLNLTNLYLFLFISSGCSYLILADESLNQPPEADDNIESHTDMSMLIQSQLDSGSLHMFEHEVSDAEILDAEIPDAEIPDAEIPDAEIPEILIPLDPTAIIGNVESIEWRPNEFGEFVWRMTGWACEVGVNEPILIDIYAGGNRETGTWLKRKPTTVPQEIAVENACNASGGSYRFNVAFEDEELLTHMGEAIFVYGVNPINELIGELNASGQHTLP